MKIKYYKNLEKVAKNMGASLFGVADMKLLREQKTPDMIEILEHIKEFDYAISIGVSLSDYIIESLIDEPTMLYKHHYRTANMSLDQIAFRLNNCIQEEGYRAFPIPAAQIINWKDMRGSLSHKVFALFAGQGWIGRSTLLVNPLYGARVRYATILTNMPLQVDKLLERDCGDCYACVKVCPADAIHNDYKDFELDKCRDLLTHFSKRVVGVHICGLCVKACKGNH